jgi:flagellar hook-basal body complex protein FliE
MAAAGQSSGLEIGEKKLPTMGDFVGPGAMGPSGPAGVPRDFGHLLTSAVQETARMGHASGDASRAFARGVNDDLHGTMISAKQAEISLKLVGSVRAKLLDAFQQLWRINV